MRFWLLALAAAAGEPASTRVELPQGTGLRDAGLIDLDGDGRLDLSLLAWTSGRSRERELRIHLARPSAPRFASEPDVRLELTPDVVALAAADVHEDPGREILLLGARAVFAWRPRASDEQQRVTLLLRHELLWNLPHAERPLEWSAGVADLDGDGLDDLLLPESGGWSVAHQSRADGARSFDAPRRLRLPIDARREDPSAVFGSELAPASEGLAARGSAGRRGITLGLGAQEWIRSPLAACSETLPALLVRDFDGDGDMDLLCLARDTVLVWIQPADRSWSAAPDLTLPAPVGRGGRRRLDPSLAALAQDMDGDRKVDIVFVTSDLRSQDARTQVMLFDQTGGALFGERGLPSSLIVVPGFAGAPQLADIDFDGRADFVATTFRPDTLDAVRSAASGSIDLELRAYRNGAAGFERKPVLQERMTIDVREEEGGFWTSFVGDVDGDGSSDLLVRESATRLAVRRLLRRKEGFVLESKAWAALDIDPEAELYLSEAAGGLAEVLAFDERGAQHWSFSVDPRRAKR